MPPPPDLTPRQREILDLIEDAIARRGAPPTRAEIAAALGFASPNAAQEHLRALERKGLIALDGSSHRGIRLLASGATTELLAARGRLVLPLVGRVAAGQPILAESNIERQIAFDPGMFRPRPDYLLRVHGMSMRDAAILDGDLVAVRRAAEARNGQIVVARLGDEATVKRYERRGERVRLLPANPDFAPIEVDPRREALALEGVVVGVIRRVPE
jgi:repressor LexA